MQSFYSNAKLNEKAASTREFICATYLLGKQAISYEAQLESSGHSREYKRVATREIDFVLGLDLKGQPKVRGMTW